MAVPLVYPFRYSLPPFVDKIIACRPHTEETHPEFNTIYRTNSYRVLYAIYLLDSHSRTLYNNNKCIVCTYRTDVRLKCQTDFSISRRVSSFDNFKFQRVPTHVLQYIIITRGRENIIIRIGKRRCNLFSMARLIASASWSHDVFPTVFFLLIYIFKVIGHLVVW